MLCVLHLCLASVSQQVGIQIIVKRCYGLVDGAATGPAIQEILSEYLR